MSNSRLHPLRVLLSTGLLWSALTMPALAAPHSAIEAAPRPDDGWKKRQATLNERAAAAGAKARVIFIGDSITQGWEGEGREVWERYYAPRAAVNLGIGGDRTQHVLWRLENGNIDGLKPKAAVVMIGTNNSNGEDNTVEQIADGIRAIVQRLREKLPETKVVLIPIFPRSENPSPQRGKILQVNQIIQRLVDDQHVFWADFGYKFLTDDGRIPKSLMPDFLHLSPAAYQIWAESIEQRLAAILGETPVTAAAAGGQEWSGEWVATVPGPNQEPVEMPFSFQQDGARLTGKFARPGDRWMEIENGRIEGGQASWTMKRDRPDGSIMTYEMTAKRSGSTLEGSARTSFQGNATEIQWTAKRR